jgi:putative SOS response-associated peptidase YedK
VWGLIPHWKKDGARTKGFINARSETLTEKPSFRDSFKRRRCLIPADGFYEWKKMSRSKIPYRISLEDKDIFAFAGIWDSYHEGDHKVDTVAIVTTESNRLLRSVHSRMPVILTGNDESIWLYEDNLAIIKKICEPNDQLALSICQISKAINDPHNESPDLIKPVIPTKEELF